MLEHRFLLTPPNPEEIAAMSFNARTEWTDEYSFPGGVHWIESGVNREAEFQHSSTAAITAGEDFTRVSPAFLNHFANFYGVGTGEAALKAHPRSARTNFRNCTADEWRAVIADDLKTGLWAEMPEATCNRFGRAP